MNDLFLDDVDDDLIRRLEERAARNGRSLEEEHRAILEEAMKPVRTGADLWKSPSQNESLLEFGEIGSRRFD